MDQTEDHREENPVPSLSTVESLVLNVIRNGEVDPHDFKDIARITNLSEVHIKVAFQLLTHKKLI